METYKYLLLILVLQQNFEHITSKRRKKGTYISARSIVNNVSNCLDVMLDLRKDWITLVTVSQWYDDMFQNWWFWYDHLNLGMKVIVIAEDSFILEKYSNHSSFSVMYFGVEQVSHCQ